MNTSLNKGTYCSCNNICIDLNDGRIPESLNTVVGNSSDKINMTYDGSFLCGCDCAGVP